ncbi:hypothetical protein [Pantoea agglomerans]|uniref:hypothetical protein n=1 Tax=Enterobacter agglomerans TaxID=549 RepID=UPI001FDABA6B|nr:hypothetical protein [Pantoea agglomerans]
MSIRQFYWGKKIDNGVQQESSFNIAPTPSAETASFSEQALYPLLIEYLSEEELHCRRIDEKRSGNNKGPGANQY